jgi:hypothetical protein
MSEADRLLLRKPRPHRSRTAGAAAARATPGPDAEIHLLDTGRFGPAHHGPVRLVVLRLELCDALLGFGTDTPFVAEHHHVHAGEQHLLPDAGLLLGRRADRGKSLLGGSPFPGEPPLGSLEDSRLFLSPYNLFGGTWVKVRVHVRVLHTQPRPGQLVAQPVPRGAAHGERTNALDELVLRHHSVGLGATQAPQQVTERSRRHGRTGSPERSALHGLRSSPDDTQKATVSTLASSTESLPGLNDHPRVRCGKPRARNGVTEREDLPEGSSKSPHVRAK